MVKRTAASHIHRQNAAGLESGPRHGTFAMRDQQYISFVLDDSQQVFLLNRSKTAIASSELLSAWLEFRETHSGNSISCIPFDRRSRTNQPSVLSPNLSIER
jgi:hypothetical protein